MKYTKFGSTSFPSYGQADDLVGDTSAMADISLPGGGLYDGWGSETADPSPRSIKLQYRLMDSSASTRETTIRTWLALRGTRANLYRELEDASEQYRAARLREVGYIRRPDEGWDNITLQFQLYGTCWKGTRHYHPANLLSNGEFSSDLDGWEEDECCVTATQETEATSPGDDTGVAKLAIHPDASEAPGLIQTIAVVADHTYKVSAQSYSPSSNSAVGQARIEALEGSDDASGDDAWEELVITAEQGTTGNEIVKLFPFTLVYALGDWVYFDAVAVEDLGFALDSSPNSYEIPNDGDTIARDIVIEVVAGDAAITSLEIENEETGHVSHIKYTGTLAATKTLEIDCGARTVENDGSDDYDNFSVESDHEIDEWLRLASGDNTIKITFTGGGTGSYIKLDYRDAYA